MFSCHLLLFLWSIRQMCLPGQDQMDFTSLSGTKTAQYWTLRSSRRFVKPRTSSQVCTRNIFSNTIHFSCFDPAVVLVVATPVNNCDIESSFTVRPWNQYH